MAGCEILICQRVVCYGASSVSVHSMILTSNLVTQGYFSISFGMDDMTSTFKEVARIPDKGEPSLHLYSVNVTLPSREDHPHHILQVPVSPSVIEWF